MSLNGIVAFRNAAAIATTGSQAPSPLSLVPTRSLFLLLAKIAAVALALTALAQDKFLAPSRVPLERLMDRYYLPSRLSRYDAKTGVHYLEYYHRRADYNDDDEEESDAIHGLPPSFSLSAGPAKGRSDDARAPRTASPYRYRALYVNHGFGASSLSFLPVLPTLADRLRCRVALGHDAPGFGLTERRQNPLTAGEESLSSMGNHHHHHHYLERYTFRGSAELGWELLRSRLGGVGADEESARQAESANHEGRDLPTTIRGGGSDDDYVADHPLPVLLLGHSMGAISTLHMALRVPVEIPVDLVLVAPALGIRRPRRSRITSESAPAPRSANATGIVATNASLPVSSPTTKARSLASGISRPWVVAAGAIRRATGSTGRSVLKYALKRAVGRPGFWKRGLRLAWGDPRSVSDADALRFQWPSVVEGWEQGLLDFAAAQQRKPEHHHRRWEHDNEDDGHDFENDDDVELLERVLRRPRTRVAVILGSRDRVVPRSRILKFFEGYPSVMCLEMPGLGHDPFEENVTAFVSLVDDVLSAPIADSAATR
jgi:pimeloyl-ACP methyl ester carboxylesterase